MADRQLYMVFGNPISPDREAEFNDWYNGTHLPDVLAVPGVLSGQRYKVNQLAHEAGTSAKFGYMTVYEIEGDPNEVLAKIGAGVAAGDVRMDGAPLDPAGVSMAFWTPITEKISRD